MNTRSPGGLLPFIGWVGHSQKNCKGVYNCTGFSPDMEICRSTTYSVFIGAPSKNLQIISRSQDS